MSAASSETRYLCHDCGYALEPIPGSLMMWCRRCTKRRRAPTHPALIFPPSGSAERARKS